MTTNIKHNNLHNSRN